MTRNNLRLLLALALILLPGADGTAQTRRPTPKPPAVSQSAIGALAFRPDGTLLALGRYREVELREPVSGRVTATLRGFVNQVRALAFSPDGRQLVVAGGNPGQFGEISLFDVATGAQLRSWRGHRDHVTSCAFAPDGKAVATASYDRTIRLWDPLTGAELRVLRDHTDAIFAIAFSSDGRFLA